MELERGIRISVLPRFRPTLLTRVELYLNSGVERSGSGFTARDDWRPLDKEELRMLIVSEADAPEDRSERIELLEIPGHLHQQWRATAPELATRSSRPSREYQRLVASLASFFCFKKVHVENCSLTIRAAEFPHGSVFASLGSPPGLKTGPVEESPLLAVNLGEEPTSLIILNLSIRRLRELVASRGMTQDLPDRITQQFMALFPKYPLVRLVLPARHGVRFFPAAVVHSGYAEKKNELDVLLESLELQNRFPKQSGLMRLS